MPTKRLKLSVLAMQNLKHPPEPQEQAFGVSPIHSPHGSAERSEKNASSASRFVFTNAPCNRLIQRPFIEHQVIEGEHICFVRFKLKCQMHSPSHVNSQVQIRNQTCRWCSSIRHAQGWFQSCPNAQQSCRFERGTGHKTMSACPQRHPR